MLHAFCAFSTVREVKSPLTRRGSENLTSPFLHCAFAFTGARELEEAEARARDALGREHREELDVDDVERLDESDENVRPAKKREAIDGAEALGVREEHLDEARDDRQRTLKPPRR